MKGNPLSQVKESVARLSSILGDEDSLGVVTFSTSAQTVVPLQPLSTAGARRNIERASESLVADGYTNMSAGLSHAALQFPPRLPDERQLVLCCRTASQRRHAEHRWTGRRGGVDQEPRRGRLDAGLWRNTTKICCWLSPTRRVGAMPTSKTPRWRPAALRGRWERSGMWWRKTLR